MWNIPIVSQPNQGPKHVHVYVPWNRRTSGFWFVKKSEIVRMINFFSITHSIFIRPYQGGTLNHIAKEILKNSSHQGLQHAIHCHLPLLLDLGHLDIHSSGWG